MIDDNDNRLSDAECQNVFDQLFPGGPASDDVQQEIAPEGWSISPLHLVFHPTLDQLYDEAMAVHRNLQSLRHKESKEPPDPPPTIDQIRARHVDKSIEAKRECLELMCLCLWDVFSDNHEVVAPDGRTVDIGSFRGSAGFLAEWADRWAGASHYQYLDFYLGTIWVSRRADLACVYQAIFHRLRHHRFDWVYHFPRLSIVDLRPLRDALRQDEGVEDYDPSEGFAREEENRAHEEQLAEVRSDLDAAHGDAVADALAHPPPPIVLAYQTEYGCFPRGWPPSV